jgi:hypothetical protein
MQTDEHLRAEELMTWKVNGRLASDEGAWLEAHLAGCAACRAELAAQQRLRAALVREPTVEFAPQSSFNRLWQQIEVETKGDGRLTPPPATEDIQFNDMPRREPRLRTDYRRVAAFAGVAAILFFGWFAWQGRARAPAADYRTVTDATAAQPARPFIKAVFDDQVRLGDVKEILTTAGLVVASGPTEAGVYTLTAADNGPPSGAATDAAIASRDRSLQRLRADPRVRFAEAGGP